MNNRRWTKDEDAALRLLVERDQREPLTGEDFLGQFRSLSGGERTIAAVNKRLWTMRRSGLTVRRELVETLATTETKARISCLASEAAPSARPANDPRATIEQVEKLIAAGVLPGDAALKALKALL
jgi:hypothetical protein